MIDGNDVRLSVLLCDSYNISIIFQGRIHQIEYAMEAVKQGSATVGLKSQTHAVLVALKVQQQILSFITSCQWILRAGFSALQDWLADCLVKLVVNFNNVPRERKTDPWCFSFWISLQSFNISNFTIIVHYMILLSFDFLFPCNSECTDIFELFTISLFWWTWHLWHFVCSIYWNELVA